MGLESRRVDMRQQRKEVRKRGKGSPCGFSLMRVKVTLFLVQPRMVTTADTFKITIVPRTLIASETLDRPSCSTNYITPQQY